MLSGCNDSKFVCMHCVCADVVQWVEFMYVSVCVCAERSVCSCMCLLCVYVCVYAHVCTKVAFRFHGSQLMVLTICSVGRRMYSEGMKTGDGHFWDQNRVSKPKCAALSVNPARSRLVCSIIVIFFHINYVTKPKDWFLEVSVSVFYYCVINDHNFTALKLHTFILSKGAMCQKSRHS